MKTKVLRIILLTCLAALRWSPLGHAQPAPVDCNCVLQLAALQTNACVAWVPDLCQLATNCFSPLVAVGSPGYCSQSPAPGTPVGPGTTFITLTVTDNQGGSAQCLVPFNVTPALACRFTLICATNKTVECGSTWIFDPPTWTNACVPPPGSPSNGVVLSVSYLTNGTCPEIITATWLGMDDCLYHDQCIQKVTVVDTTNPGLDCNCLTNQAVNPVITPLTVTNCNAVIPDLCLPATICASDNCGPPTCSQTPPAGTPVGPGVHPITIIVTDCATNSASCVVNFTVITPTGGCSTNCLPPPTGMVAWWPLDELCGAAFFADVSGNGNLALVESGGPTCSGGSPSAQGGKVAGANYFYGQTVRGRATSPSLNFGTTSFSADCWVDPVLTGPAAWHPIVDKLQQTSATTGFGYKLGLLNQNLVLVVGSGNLYTNTSLGSITYGPWNFVAVAVDRVASTVTFHVNGVTEAPVPFTAPGSLNSTVDLLVGGTWVVNQGYGETALDEVELFSRAITSADMTALYQADSNGKCKTNQPCAVTITCPTNIVVHTCGTNAVVTYSAPVLSGPCASNATVICQPPSGSTFPPGPTTVFCTVLDGSGQPAGSCRFTVTVVTNSTGAYDFLPVTIPGAGGKFTSPNGNGFITAQTAGGPFLGLNNTMYPSQFPNLFAASGPVQGYLAQADFNATFTVTFDLQNYTLSPATVFGIWSITEETDSYKVEVFNCANTLIAPPFPPYFGFMGWDDDVLSGNIGWYHMTLNPTTGFLSTSNFKAAGIDSDAAFWTNLPPNTCKIVVTGKLGPSDGVVFYFAEPKPCCEITCPSNIVVSACGAGAVVNYPPPTLAGPCATNATIVCTPPSGSTFPIGTTTVTCTATGPQGQDSCTFTVTVNPAPPPTIICPTNIVAKYYYSCITNGTIVAYPPPQVSNGTLVSCTPPSSSFFPIGLTTVTCVATNACGTNSCSFTVSVIFDPTYGISPPCTPPPANMVMWLRFDETTGPSAFNSAAGNHGYLAGNPTRTLGQFAVNSLCFNGVNQYVQVTPYAAMQFGTNDFTVDVWVKPATLTNTIRTIVDHREENGGVTRGYSLFLGTNNTVGFQLADGTPMNYYFASAVPADGFWHFIAISVRRNDPQGIRLYVDGVADASPRNPTVRPGSVTAGPCYPFRVASRSSSITGLFPGCIDEVELFRRALAPAEIQALYNARCKGKCRIVCNAGGFNDILQCWVGPPITNLMLIYNLYPSQPFTWSIQSLPVGGNCTKPCPPFSPSSGTGTANGNGYGVIQPVITLPAGFDVGDCVCWRLTVTLADGQQTVCDGAYCLKGVHNVCVAPPLAPGQATNLEPGTVEFSFEGTGSSSTVLANPVAVLRNPEHEVVSLIGLPPITVPPAGGGTIQVPTSFAFPDYDPGRVYHVTIEADLDGLGVHTTLASVPFVNVVPPTPEEAPIEARLGPGGKIIIVWPDPCGTIEINPNPWNPVGWVNGPVQTSPWEFLPPPGTNSLFMRLRK